MVKEGRKEGRGYRQTDGREETGRKEGSEGSNVVKEGRKAGRQASRKAGKREGRQEGRQESGKAGR